MLLADCSHVVRPIAAMLFGLHDCGHLAWPGSRARPGSRRGRMKIFRRSMMAGLAVGTLALLAACGSSSSSSAGSGGSGPITIGASLSLSGDFAADGQAFQRGYQLWAKDQNAKGGLLGHKIKLEILSDASSASQVDSNYQKLFG